MFLKENLLYYTTKNVQKLALNIYFLKVTHLPELNSIYTEQHVIKETLQNISFHFQQTISCHLSAYPFF